MSDSEQGGMTDPPIINPPADDSAPPSPRDATSGADNPSTAPDTGADPPLTSDSGPSAGGQGAGSGLNPGSAPQQVRRGSWKQALLSAGRRTSRSQGPSSGVSSAGPVSGGPQTAPVRPAPADGAAGGGATTGDGDDDDGKPVTEVVDASEFQVPGRDSDDTFSQRMSSYMRRRRSSAARHRNRNLSVQFTQGDPTSTSQPSGVARVSSAVRSGLDDDPDDFLFDNHSSRSCSLDAGVRELRRLYMCMYWLSVRKFFREFLRRSARRIREVSARKPSVNGASGANGVGFAAGGPSAGDSMTRLAQHIMENDFVSRVSVATHAHRQLKSRGSVVMAGGRRGSTISRGKLAVEKQKRKADIEKAESEADVKVAGGRSPAADKAHSVWQKVRKTTREMAVVRALKPGSAVSSLGTALFPEGNVQLFVSQRMMKCERKRFRTVWKAMDGEFPRLRPEERRRYKELMQLLARLRSSDELTRAVEGSKASPQGQSSSDGSRDAQASSAMEHGSLSVRARAGTVAQRPGSQKRPLTTTSADTPVTPTTSGYITALDVGMPGALYDILVTLRREEVKPITWHSGGFLAAIDNFLAVLLYRNISKPPTYFAPVPELKRGQSVIGRLLSVGSSKSKKSGRRGGLLDIPDDTDEDTDTPGAVEMDNLGKSAGDPESSGSGESQPTKEVGSEVPLLTSPSFMRGPGFKHRELFMLFENEAIPSAKGSPDAEQKGGGATERGKTKRGSLFQAVGLVQRVQQAKRKFDSSCSSSKAQPASATAEPPSAQPSLASASSTRTLSQKKASARTRALTLSVLTGKRSSVMVGNGSVRGKGLLSPSDKSASDLSGRKLSEGGRSQTPLTGQAESGRCCDVVARLISAIVILALVVFAVGALWNVWHHDSADANSQAQTRMAKEILSFQAVPLVFDFLRGGQLHARWLQSSLYGSRDLHFAELNQGMHKPGFNLFEANSTALFNSTRYDPNNAQGASTDLAPLASELVGDIIASMPFQPAGLRLDALMSAQLRSGLPPVAALHLVSAPGIPAPYQVNETALQYLNFTQGGNVALANGVPAGTNLSALLPTGWNTDLFHQTVYYNMTEWRALVSDALSKGQTAGDPSLQCAGDTDRGYGAIAGTAPTVWTDRCEDWKAQPGVWWPRAFDSPPPAGLGVYSSSVLSYSGLYVSTYDNSTQRCHRQYPMMRGLQPGTMRNPLLEYVDPYTTAGIDQLSGTQNPNNGNATAASVFAELTAVLEGLKSSGQTSGNATVAAQELCAPAGWDSPEFLPMFSDGAVSLTNGFSPPLFLNSHWNGGKGGLTGWNGTGSHQATNIREVFTDDELVSGVTYYSPLFEYGNFRNQTDGSGPASNDPVRSSATLKGWVGVDLPFWSLSQTLSNVGNPTYEGRVDLAARDSNGAFKRGFDDKGGPLSKIVEFAADEFSGSRFVLFEMRSGEVLTTSAGVSPGVALTVSSRLRSRYNLTALAPQVGDGDNSSQIASHRHYLSVDGISGRVSFAVLRVPVPAANTSLFHSHRYPVSAATQGPPGASVSLPSAPLSSQLPGQSYWVLAMVTPSSDFDEVSNRNDIITIVIGVVVILCGGFLDYFSYFYEVGSNDEDDVLGASRRSRSRGSSAGFDKADSDGLRSLSRGAADSSSGSALAGLTSSVTMEQLEAQRRTARRVVILLSVLAILGISLIFLLWSISLGTGVEETTDLTMLETHQRTHGLMQRMTRGAVDGSRIASVTMAAGVVGQTVVDGASADIESLYSTGLLSETAVSKPQAHQHHYLSYFQRWDGLSSYWVTAPNASVEWYLRNALLQQPRSASSAGSSTVNGTTMEQYFRDLLLSQSLNLPMGQALPFVQRISFVDHQTGELTGAQWRTSVFSQQSLNSNFSAYRSYKGTFQTQSHSKPGWFAMGTRSDGQVMSSAEEEHGVDASGVRVQQRRLRALSRIFGDSGVRLEDRRAAFGVDSVAQQGISEFTSGGAYGYDEYPERLVPTAQHTRYPSNIRYPAHIDSYSRGPAQQRHPAAHQRHAYGPASDWRSPARFRPSTGHAEAARGVFAPFARRDGDWYGGGLPGDELPAEPQADTTFVENSVPAGAYNGVLDWNSLFDLTRVLDENGVSDVQYPDPGHIASGRLPGAAEYGFVRDSIMRDGVALLASDRYTQNCLLAFQPSEPRAGQQDDPNLNLQRSYQQGRSLSDWELLVDGSAGRGGTRGAVLSDASLCGSDLRNLDWYAEAQAAKTTVVGSLRSTFNDPALAFSSSRSSSDADNVFLTSEALLSLGEGAGAGMATMRHAPPPSSYRYYSQVNPQYASAPGLGSSSYGYAHPYQRYQPQRADSAGFRSLSTEGLPGMHGEFATLSHASSASESSTSSVLSVSGEFVGLTISTPVYRHQDAVTALDGADGAVDASELLGVVSLDLNLLYMSQVLEWAPAIFLSELVRSFVQERQHGSDLQPVAVAASAAAALSQTTSSLHAAVMGGEMSTMALTEDQMPGSGGAGAGTGVSGRRGMHTLSSSSSSGSGGSFRASSAVSVKNEEYLAVASSRLQVAELISDFLVPMDIQQASDQLTLSTAVYLQNMPVALDQLPPTYRGDWYDFDSSASERLNRSAQVSRSGGGYLAHTDTPTVMRVNRGISQPQTVFTALDLNAKAYELAVDAAFLNDTASDKPPSASIGQVFNAPVFGNDWSVVSIVAFRGSLRKTRDLGFLITAAMIFVTLYLGVRAVRRFSSELRRRKELSENQAAMNSLGSEDLDTKNIVQMKESIRDIILDGANHHMKESSFPPERDLPAAVFDPASRPTVAGAAVEDMDVGLVEVDFVTMHYARLGVQAIRDCRKQRNILTLAELRQSQHRQRRFPQQGRRESCPGALRMYHIMTHPLYDMLVYLVLVTHIVLQFSQAGTQQELEANNGLNWESAVGYVEVVCLIVEGLDLIFDTLVNSCSVRNLLSDDSTAARVARFVVWGLVVLDFFTSVTFAFSFEYYFPVTWLLLVLRNGSLRGGAVAFLTTLAVAWDVFLMFMVLILMSAVISVLLLRRYFSESDLLLEDTAGLFFPGPSFINVFNALTTMFIFTATGENYTEVVYPSFDANSYLVLYFLVLLLLGLFFVLAMVIASFEDSFKRQRTDAAKRELLFSRTGYISAFILLDVHGLGYIPRLTMARFLLMLEPRLNKDPRVLTDMFLFYLGKPWDDSHINAAEFVAGIEELQLDVRKYPTDPPNFIRRKLQQFFNSETFRTVTVAFVFAQVWLLCLYGTYNNERLVDVALAILFVTFLGEHVLKLAAFGPSAWWYSAYYQWHTGAEYGAGRGAGGDDSRSTSPFQSMAGESEPLPTHHHHHRHPEGWSQVSLADLYQATEASDSEDSDVEDGAPTPASDATTSVSGRDGPLSGPHSAGVGGGHPRPPTLRTAQSNPSQRPHSAVPVSADFSGMAGDGADGDGSSGASADGDGGGDDSDSPTPPPPPTTTDTDVDADAGHPSVADAPNSDPTATQPQPVNSHFAAPMVMEASAALGELPEDSSAGDLDRTATLEDVRYDLDSDVSGNGGGGNGGGSGLTLPVGAPSGEDASSHTLPSQALPPGPPTADHDAAAGPPPTSGPVTDGLAATVSAQQQQELKRGAGLIDEESASDLGRTVDEDYGESSGSDFDPSLRRLDTFNIMAKPPLPPPDNQPAVPAPAPPTLDDSDVHQMESSGDSSSSAGWSPQPEVRVAPRRAEDGNASMPDYDVLLNDGVLGGVGGIGGGESGLTFIGSYAPSIAGVHSPSARLPSNATNGGGGGGGSTNNTQHGSNNNDNDNNNNTGSHPSSDMDLYRSPEPSIPPPPGVPDDDTPPQDQGGKSGGPVLSLSPGSFAQGGGGDAEWGLDAPPPPPPPREPPTVTVVDATDAKTGGGGDSGSVGAAGGSASSEDMEVEDEDDTVVDEGMYLQLVIAQHRSRQKSLYQMFAHRFELVVMLISAAAMFLLLFQKVVNDESVEDDSLRFVLALPAVRLFTIFKKLRRLCYFLFRSLPTLLPIVLLMSLVIYAYAIVGTNWFSNEFVKLQTRAPEGDFDTLGHSFLVLFQIFIGEAWYEVMYAGIDATEWGASVYFVSFVVVNSILFGNLLISLFLDRRVQALKDKLPGRLVGRFRGQVEAADAAGDEHDDVSK